VLTLTCRRAFGTVAPVNRWLLLPLLTGTLLLLLPQRCPAPFVYRPGEGWIYEPVGGGGWQRTRAKDQLDVAKEAFEQERYRVATKAARRVVAVWPFSDYAPEAQYILGRCYEERGQDERAFAQYQILVERYPRIETYQEVLQRQFEIANRFLGGQWFRLWGVIPAFPSMEKTIEMYGKLIQNGPFSPVAPRAQINVGAANEKRHDYPAAVKAYSTAADRYHDQKDVAAEALFKAGLAYHKQARTADYDQSVAGQAIATFTDFIALFPNDPRVPEAQRLISSMKTEQARGSYDIARFYEKRHRYAGALVYYNEVLLKDPNSPHAPEARVRIEALQAKLTGAPPAASK
jgi:outer membrane protein assembly factor BamD